MGWGFITYGSAVKVVGGEEKTGRVVKVAEELPGFVLSACLMWGRSRARKKKQGSACLIVSNERVRVSVLS